MCFAPLVQMVILAWTVPELSCVDKQVINTQTDTHAHDAGNDNTWVKWPMGPREPEEIQL